MDVFRRQTVLDVIENNLRLINTRTFVLRVIFAGKHNFPSPENLSSAHGVFVQKINSGYSDVPVYGLLLLYKKHFFIISEGSENTLIRQMDAFLKSDDLTSNVTELKILAVYHNVKKLLFTSWKTIYAEPLEMITTIEGELTQMKVMEILKACLEKLKYLCLNPNNPTENDIENRMKSFPEITFINILLSSPCIMDFKKYRDLYLNLEEYSYTFENSWPAPFDFTPCLEIEETPKSTFVELLSSIDDFIMIEKSKESESED